MSSKRFKEFLKRASSFQAVETDVTIVVIDGPPKRKQVGGVPGQYNSQFIC